MLLRKFVHFVWLSVYTFSYDHVCRPFLLTSGTLLFLAGQGKANLNSITLFMSILQLHYQHSCIKDSRPKLKMHADTIASIA